MTAFFCDSNCELNYKYLEELNITNVIYMPYSICDEEKYFDMGKAYDAKAFFDLVRAGNTPKTSALNPAEYITYFEPFFAKGEDIFYVSFSHSMSGTFKYMDMAIKELSAKYPNVKFTCYDTKAISMSAGLMVYAAAKQFNAGKSVDEICAYLDEIQQHMHAHVTVDDLQYLKRGGRITATSAIIGGLLKLKPLIKLVDFGMLQSFGTVPGRNKAMLSLADEVIKTATDIKDFPIAILTADCRPEAERVKARILSQLPDATVILCDVGPTIGAHCGPGTIGICFKSTSTRPVAPKAK
ncbi:MAG: DegV family protein [Bacillota bacterium]